MDPFTQDKLVDLPSESIFSFIKTKYVYAFSGSDFFQHCYTHGYIYNPLTRSALQEDVKIRLYKWWRMYEGRTNNLIASQEYAVTPGTVITDAVSQLEALHHICIQPSWLLQLSEIDVMSIFSRYHHNMHIYGPHVPYMSRRAEENSFTIDDPGPSLMVLGKEMLTMIREEQAPSFYVCNLVLILSEFCPNLSACLPHWVRDAAADG